MLTLLLTLVGALLLAVPALADDSPRAPQAAVGGPPTDQLVIRLAAGQSLDTAALAATAGVDLRQVRMLSDGSYVLKLSKRHSLETVEAITDRLAARGDVVSVEPDEMMQPLQVPTDPFWSDQWDFLDPVSGLYGDNLPAAWDLTTGSTGVTVAVIDTGYRPHADLAGRFVPGYDFIGDSLVANDGGGRDSDASDPGDWITNAENANGYFAGCPTGNSSWHGTHVSGTIGAVPSNGLGVAGINWVSKIQPLRVLGKCGGYTSDIADAIRWAAGLTVPGVPTNPTPDDVVNLSLGGDGACESTFQNAINAAVAAGTVVVIAAGNGNTDAANSSPGNCNNVITVASTGHTGSRAYYSNYGSTVEIAAPGGDSHLGKTILSTLNAGTTTPGADSYANYQGTSMATPHVVGIVSLMLSVNPSLTPAQVTTMLRSTATPFPAGSTCSTATCGSGIANAAAAVALAQGGGGPTPPGTFGKASPGNLASVPGTSVTLQWSASAGATSYAYCIDTTSDSVCSTSWVGAGTATSASVTGLSAGTTYYWQVRASNAGGDTTADAGAWWTFVTQTPSLPGSFSKTSPRNGQKSLSTTVTFTWQASAGAASYEWCVSSVNGSCAGWTSTSATTTTVSVLRTRSTYYWQVRAVNANGKRDATGGWWSLRTK